MKLAASIGIIYKNSILLGKRARKCYIDGHTLPLAGYWSIFGGSLDEGETFQSGAIRELFEETKITVEHHQLIDGCTIKNKNLRLKIFFVEIDKMLTPEINPEHTEYGWFDIDELDSFPYEITKDLVECVKKYKNCV